MSTKKDYMVIFIAILSGIISGIVSPYLLTSKLAVAQSEPYVIRARQFSLTDSKGNDRARLGLSGPEREYTYFYLMDVEGNIRFQIVIPPKI